MKNFIELILNLIDKIPEKYITFTCVYIIAVHFADNIALLVIKSENKKIKKIKSKLHYMISRKNHIIDINVHNTERKVHSKNRIVVEEIYSKKKKQYNKLSIIIVSSILIYCFMNMLFHTEVKTGILLFLYGLFALITIEKLIVHYRIEKGFYGTNYEESKEILHYLLEDQDKNDKNSGKKIFNEIEERNNSKEKLPVSGGNLEY